MRSKPPLHPFQHQHQSCTLYAPEAWQKVTNHGDLSIVALEYFGVTAVLLLGTLRNYEGFDGSLIKEQKQQ